MKFQLLGALAALSLLGLGSAARADIAWETDYQRASALSRASGKPLFIDFYTDWCGWCKKLDTDVYPDPRVQQLARSFVMLKVNAEGPGAPYAKAYKVNGYPAMYFVSSQNRMLGEFGGYVDANTFAAGMQQALNRETAVKQALGASKSKNTTVRRQAGRALNQMATVPAGASDWRSQPDLRKLASQSNAGGVFLLDETGVVPLDSRAKKAVAKSKKTASTSRQKRTKRVRR